MPSDYKAIARENMSDPLQRAFAEAMQAVYSPDQPPLDWDAIQKRMEEA